jgi:Cys-rich four helix bundle protein (predicted Tat secretion target)
MNRREAMLGSSAFAATLALGTLSCARDAVAQSAAGAHAGHAGHHMGGGDPALLDAVHGCLKAGNACMSHCLGMIAAGDTTMSGCAPAGFDMLAAMEAVSKIASRGGPKAMAFAKSALGFCVDCEAECKKHAGHHAECKGCMEACQAMISALKPVLAG